MNISIVQMAFESLLAKKTRSFLSMLGIIIGVATVIAVFAIGQGAQQAVNNQFRNLSANSLIVMSSGGRGATASSKLTTSDAKIILDGAEHIASATGAIQGQATVSFGSVEDNYSVIGVDENFLDISKLTVETGEGISSTDVDSRSLVAVIGATAASDLFAETDPLGQQLSVGGRRLEVVGVLKKLGSRIGMVNVDEAIIVPATTAEKSILGTRGQVMITAQVDDLAFTGTATSSITSILRSEHKLKIDQSDDFRIMDAGSMVASAQESAKTMKLLLTAIAAITLLVSGIGIMNVMFVTVAERTKEIGIAKAIGGQQSDILSQFLMESVILSMIGGLIGIVLGQIAIYLISYFNFMAMAASATGPAIGFGFSVLVGIFFGFYPAWQASRLDPVDALRSE